MKLIIGTGSPFVRKCRIAVREKGLTNQVEEFVTAATDDAPELLAINPISQIPALQTDDGVNYFDSGLICQWLDAHFDSGLKLYPMGGEAYWRARRLEVLADGLLEMTVKMVLENRRPESERSAMWLARWERNLMRGFAVAEAECPTLDEVEQHGLDMGSITLAIAATYLEFRYPHIEWKSTSPNLVALKTALEKRPSFIDTYPR
ncbi:glutathione S-transferase N-terminal domain-containing protein [Asticcacaulis sp. SL142]|uniref:glutathione S-transferase N-terminal domain-containing protein n=1 Tax=Asticcacaulis sp. SL142 TaxID=2995155 RepID=UPI00226D137A|nr:glutathione S-transferase N-terminal domain-containing protein [Asticcacaulis sp. SL142]WAC49887.1 glutathione S-transferase N-terminal domain-containing protein [Asticcacaulis sp. SL142]